MKTLDEYRQKIDVIDAQLLKLFEERMHVVGKIGLYKRKKCLPIYNLQREKENMQRMTDETKSDSIKAYVISWYRYMMKLSRRYQEEIYMHKEEK